jgi:hypothetical protein
MGIYGLAQRVLYQPLVHLAVDAHALGHQFDAAFAVDGSLRHHGPGFGQFRDRM